MKSEVKLLKKAKELLVSLPAASRTKAVKILELLEEKGTYLAAPYVKNISGKLWELRAGQTRLFYFLSEGVFVVVSGFVKKTQKTPKNEIDKALGEIKKYLEGSG